MELSAGMDIQTLLDTLEGVAYATSPEGVILGYGIKQWEEFARRNGAEELAQPGNVCGRLLSEFIAGSLVRLLHEATAVAVSNHRQSVLSYSYRCDTPTLRRDMLMRVSALERNGELVALLYHSVCIRELPQASFGFLEQRKRAEALGAGMLRICSYCRSVRFPPDADETTWIAPEHYYELGGSDEIIPSHGICPDCWTTIAEPLLSSIRETNPPT